jgi:hypothetical protein
MNSSAHEWNMLAFSESFNLSTQLSFLLKSKANLEGGGAQMGCRNMFFMGGTSTPPLGQTGV